MNIKLDISESISESADNLLSLNLTNCDSELLELAIAKWLEEFIEDLPTDIDWHFHNNSTLNKLIFEAECESEHLIDLSEVIESNHDDIDLSEFLDDESLAG